MSSKHYKVHIYPSAESDLLEIREYFEHKLKASPNHLFQEFLDAIDLIEVNPFIHPLLKDPYLNQIGYRMIPVDNFLVFYVVANDEIQIHRFLYGKRDYLLIL